MKRVVYFSICLILSLLLSGCTYYPYTAIRNNTAPIEKEVIINTVSGQVYSGKLSSDTVADYYNGDLKGIIELKEYPTFHDIKVIEVKDIETMVDIP